MSLLSAGKTLIKRNPKIRHIALLLVNKFPFNNIIRLNCSNSAGTLLIDNSLLLHSKIINRGINNKIILQNNCNLKNCKITIRGNNNIITLGENVSIRDGELWIEDDNNEISVGNQTQICGRTHLACIEGCKIQIGERCLFSSDVVFRTGDSHSILDMNGNRTNPSQDITVADHVWFGNKTTINKGASLEKNTIVATGAIVTNKITSPNVIVGGIPAKIVKSGVNWDVRRL